MKRLLFLLLSIPLLAFGAAPVNQVPTTATEFALNRWMGPAALANALGTLVLRGHTTAYGVFDVSQIAGTIGTYNVGILLPNKAIIRNCLLDVITTPTSGGSATVAFGANTATDLKGATAIASYSGLVACVPVGSAATSVKTTAARQVFATVATCTLATGKIKVFLDYVLSE